MSSPIITRTAEPPADWGSFAREHGTFYHLPEWARCIGDIYRLRLDYYSAHTSGELQGILAVAEVPPLLGPRRLVSLPFSYAAGVLATNGSIADSLAAAVREGAADRRIRRVELKSRGQFPPAPGFQRTSHYSTYEVPTEGGEREVWERLHSGSTQRSIRKGLKAGIVVRRGDTAEDWQVMAELEERTAHGHGLPSPPRRFFVQGGRRLQEAGLAAVYLAFTPAGERAAAITVWKGPRSWIYGFGASDPAHLEHRPNHVLLWTAIQDAIAAGCSFDLGRVAPEQEGLLEFKRRWGGQAIQLAYDYWPEPGGLNMAPRDRGAMAAVAAAWSRLPAPVARLGAGLYRYLG
jgi:GNAT acetyltransferase-like protein